MNVGAGMNVIPSSSWRQRRRELEHGTYLRRRPDPVALIAQFLHPGCPSTDVAG